MELNLLDLVFDHLTYKEANEALLLLDRDQVFEDYKKYGIENCIAPDKYFESNQELYTNPNDVVTNCKLIEWLKYDFLKQNIDIFIDYLIDDQNNGIIKRPQVLSILIKYSQNSPQEVEELLLLNSKNNAINFLITQALPSQEAYMLKEETIDYYENELNKNKYSIELKQYITTILLNNVINFNTGSNNEIFVSKIFSEQELSIEFTNHVIEKFLVATQSGRIFDAEVFKNFESLLGKISNEKNLLVFLAYGAKNTKYYPALKYFSYFEKFLVHEQYTESFLQVISKGLESLLRKKTPDFKFIQNKIDSLLNQDYKFSTAFISKVFEFYRDKLSSFMPTLIKIIEDYPNFPISSLNKLVEPLLKLISVTKDLQLSKNIIFVVNRLYTQHIIFPDDALSYFVNTLNNNDLQLQRSVINLYQKFLAAGFTIKDEQIKSLDVSKNIVEFLESKNTSKKIKITQDCLSYISDSTAVKLEHFFKIVILEQNRQLLELAIDGLSNCNQYKKIAFNTQELIIVKASESDYVENQLTNILNKSKDEIFDKINLNKSVRDLYKLSRRFPVDIIITNSDVTEIKEQFRKIVSVDNSELFLHIILNDLEEIQNYIQLLNENGVEGYALAYFTCSDEDIKGTCLELGKSKNYILINIESSDIYIYNEHDYYPSELETQTYEYDYTQHSKLSTRILQILPDVITVTIDPIEIAKYIPNLELHYINFKEISNELTNGNALINLEKLHNIRLDTINNLKDFLQLIILYKVDGFVLVNFECDDISQEDLCYYLGKSISYILINTSFPDVIYIYNKYNYEPTNLQKEKIEYNERQQNILKEAINLPEHNVIITDFTYISNYVDNIKAINFKEIANRSNYNNFYSKILNNVELSTPRELKDLLQFCIQHKLENFILSDIINNPISLEDLYFKLVQKILVEAIGDKKGLQQFINLIPLQVGRLYRAGWSVSDIKLSLSKLNHDNIAYFLNAFEKITNYNFPSNIFNKDGLTIPEILSTHKPFNFAKEIQKIYNENNFYAEQSIEEVLDQLRAKNSNAEILKLIDNRYFQNKLDEIKDIEEIWPYNIDEIKITYDHQPDLAEENKAYVYCKNEQIIFSIGNNNIIIASDTNNSDLFIRLNNIILYQQPIHTDDIQYMHKLIKEGIHKPIISINNWQEEDFLIWKSSIEQVDNTNIAEVLAVLKQVAYNTVFNKKYYPRDVQIIAVLALFNSDTGRLAEVSTGEGKSLIIDIFATIKILNKRKVNIVTSSRELAVRDAEEQEAFYQALGITVAHNIGGNSNYPKNCYLADVVYGDMLNFAGDRLRDRGFGTLNGRNLEDLIIDEVDNLLIDLNSMMVRLSSHSPAFFYLKPLIMYMWSLHPYAFNANSDICNPDSKNASYNECIKNVKEFIKEITNRKLVNYNIATDERVAPLPANLQNFIAKQLPNWLDSLITAFIFKEKKHYTITGSFEGDVTVNSNIRTAAPVDYDNTGTINKKMVWSNSLHQFISLKHGLLLDAENLIGLFISYVSYFLQFKGSIFGLTGTLGNKANTNFLRQTYDVDFVYIPTFKLKKHIIFPEVITNSYEEWLEQIINTSIRRVINDERAVLIITYSIEEADHIYEALIQHDYPIDQMIKYTNGTEEERVKVEKEEIKKGFIIIATNLAGRGCDVKISKQVERNGGLHVILSYFPEIIRAEKQAFERAARKGEAGSAQLIIIDENKYGCKDIACLRENRDKLEDNKFYYQKKCQLPIMMLKGQLFSIFEQFLVKINSPIDYYINATTLPQKLEPKQIYLYKNDSNKVYVSFIRAEDIITFQINPLLELLNSNASKHIISVLNDNNRYGTFTRQELDLIYFIVAIKGLSVSTESKFSLFGQIVYEDDRIARIKELLNAHIKVCLYKKHVNHLYEYSSLGSTLSFLDSCDSIISGYQLIEHSEFLRKTYSVNNADPENETNKIIRLKYLYKLWKDDLKLYNKNAENSQLQSHWEMWFYNQEDLFREFEQNCNELNNSEANDQLVVLKNKLHSSLNEFIDTKGKEYNSLSLFNEPKYLLNQAAAFNNIFTSESYKLRFYKMKQSLCGYEYFSCDNEILPDGTHPLDKALNSTNKAIIKDSEISWSAYQHQLIIRLAREVPNIFHETHANKAQMVKIATLENLLQAVGGLDRIINQIDGAMKHLAMNQLLDPKTELMAQYVIERKLYVESKTKLRNGIEIVNKALENPLAMVYISEQFDSYSLIINNTNMTESYEQALLALQLNSTSINELASLHANNTALKSRVVEQVLSSTGLVLINLNSFTLRQEEKDWFGSVFSGVFGIAQIVMGLGVVAMGGPFLSSFGVSMITSGISDCISTFIAAIEGQAVDMSNYFQSKAITYAISIATAGIMKMAAEPAQNANQLGNLAPKPIDKLEIFKSVLKTYAINSAIEAGAKYVANKIVNSNDGDIEAKTRNAINALLTQYEQELKIIFVGDSIDINQNIKQQLENNAKMVALNGQKEFHDVLTTVATASAATVAGLSENIWVSTATNVIASTSLALLKLSGFTDNFRSEFGPYISSAANQIKSQYPTSALMENKLKIDYQNLANQVITALKKELFIDSNGNIDYSQCNKINNYQQENFELEIAKIKKACDDIYESYLKYIEDFRQALYSILFGQMRFTLRDDLIKPIVQEAGVVGRYGILTLIELQEKEEARNRNAKVNLETTKPETAVFEEPENKKKTTSSALGKKQESTNDNTKAATPDPSVKSLVKGEKVYDEPAGPDYNQETRNNLRIEAQKKEIIENLKTQFNKAKESDQIPAFKRADQVYIISKHIVGGGVLMSKEVFADNFPNMYENLATYSDELGQFIGEGINNIDTKLSNVLGDKYVSFKHYTKELFTEFDKNAPQIVKDGLGLFIFSGAGKVVFNSFEAGIAGAAKLAKKFDLPNSKKSDILDNLHKRADVPDHDAQSYSASKQFASDLQMNEPGQVIAGSGSNTIFRDASQKAQRYGGSPEDYVKKTSSSYLAADSSLIETHWIENIKTGQRYESKSIIKKVRK